MKKRSFVLTLLILFILCLFVCSCSTKQSTFNIQFIDVGQGDAALVECDGRYMLIDGGDETAGDIVYSVLEERRIQHLDILVISHMHRDHFGGLSKALTYVSKIDLTLSNSNYGQPTSFGKVEHELGIIGSQITVPHMGDKYKFGSAEIEVVDVESLSENDSLVLLITYGKTRFLFSGDIEDKAQTRISEKYENEKDEAYKIDLIKMPHHGSNSPKSVNGTGSLYHFIRTFMPDYAVISVGKGNMYGHPHRETLDLLEDAGVKIYRTDLNGNITVSSDGRNISVKKEK